MKRQSGYIKVSRDILNNPLYQDGKMFDLGKVLFDLNLRAFHSNTSKVYKNKMESYKKGQIECSYRQMAKWWNMSDKTVESRLMELQINGYIWKDTVNGRTVITLRNYSAEQEKRGFGCDTDSDTDSEANSDTCSETNSDTCSDNYNNYKECNNNDSKMKKEAFSFSCVGGGANIGATTKDRYYYEE